MCALFGLVVWFGWLVCVVLSFVVVICFDLCCVELCCGVCVCFVLF